MNRLVTIPFSHYNEKARWGLDRYKVAYRESPWLPGLHLLPVALATWQRGDAAADSTSSRYSTPVFLPAGGTPICDSSRILQWIAAGDPAAAAELYPQPQAQEYDRLFSTQLGPHTRRLGYYALMRSPAAMHAITRGNVGPLQGRIYGMLERRIRQQIVRGFGIDERGAEESMSRVRDLAGEISNGLRGRTYLVGHHFSVADLSLACMLAPILCLGADSGFGARLPGLDEVEPEAAAFSREIRSTPAGAHALKMFAAERKAGARPPV